MKKLQLEHKSFVSAIANVGTWSLIALAITKQFADQVKTRLSSELVNGISRTLLDDNWVCGSALFDVKKLDILKNNQYQAWKR